MDDIDICNEGDIITSPSRMTDFFKSMKSPVKGSKKIKAATSLDTSSVYLTPESSPAKDQSSVVTNAKADGLSSENEVLKCQLTETLLVCDSNNQESDASSDCQSEKADKKTNECNLSEKSIMSSENSLSGETADSVTEDVRDSGQETLVNGHITRDLSGLKEIVMPVLSHSPTTEYNARTKESTENSLVNPLESATVSSPSLPRPKVRKGPQPKKALATNSHTSESSQVKPRSGRRKKKEPVPVQSSIITDFFPVRRSGRQTKREIEKQKQDLVEKLITSNCEDGLEVTYFEGKGRGVVATKDFDKGDFVVEYAGDRIDITDAREREQKYSETPEVGCYMYYFIHAGKHYCVDATPETDRLGRLINHSRDGNCCTRVVPLDDGPRLILIAAKDIKIGQELSYDYGDRRKSSLEAHPWLKL